MLNERMFEWAPRQVHPSQTAHHRYSTHCAKISPHPILNSVWMAVCRKQIRTFTRPSQNESSIFVETHSIFWNEKKRNNFLRPKSIKFYVNSGKCRWTKIVLHELIILHSSQKDTRFLIYFKIRVKIERQNRTTGWLLSSNLKLISSFSLNLNKTYAYRQAIDWYSALIYISRAWKNIFLLSSFWTWNVRNWFDIIINWLWLNWSKLYIVHEQSH